MSQIHRSLLLLLGISYCLSSLAQSDTEFWFVAPEISAEHGDSPLAFVISATGNPANIRVSMPADTSFVPITIELGADEVSLINLTPLKEILENKPANEVLTKGLHIESSSPINITYRCTNSFNQDIYTLKGRNALGKSFMIPSQNDFNNVLGQASFDIVATQDSTTLMIDPSTGVIGNNSGNPISVVLNMGETFSVRALGQAVRNHLGGSTVIADKPIAITNSDDSIINGPNSGWDIIGDQLIPIDLLGTEYIAVRGLAITERVYVMATEDDTQLEVTDFSPNSVIINKGQTAKFNITGNALHIKSNKPIYVWQLTGIQREPGGALLPEINCSGSREVGFLKPNVSQVSLMLLTRDQFKDGFQLDGNPDLVNTQNFSQVRGSLDGWVSARISINALDPGFHRLINTKGSFHMGILSANSSTASFGYYSAFSALNLGICEVFCAGDTLVLDAGNDKLTYLWNDGSTSPTLPVTQGGKYWVEVTTEECQLSDTLEVEQLSLAIDIGEDTTLCSGESLLLNAFQEDSRYRWQDGSFNSSYLVNEAGTYFVEIQREECKGWDTIDVSYINPKPLELGPDTLLCEDELLLLDVSANQSLHIWEDGTTDPVRIVDTAGTYWVDRIFDGCILSDTIRVNTTFPEFSLVNDTTLCEGDSLLLSFEGMNWDISWDDGSILPTRNLYETGIYTVTISDRCQRITDTIAIDLQNCDCELFVPNVFTPNQDGINERFLPELNCPIANFDLHIYDRWGKLVYSSQQLSQGWDGRSNGKALAAGVYYWIIEYEGADPWNDENRIKKGYVSLLK